MLPWEETDASGIRLDAQGRGQIMVDTPQAGSETAVTKRTATFRLLPEGTLQGQLQVAFTGQEALSRRRVAAAQDESGRRPALEEEVKSWLPPGSTVELISAREWAGSEDPLQAECRIRIPNFGDLQGCRPHLPAVR